MTRMYRLKINGKDFMGVQVSLLPGRTVIATEEQIRNNVDPPYAILPDGNLYYREPGVDSEPVDLGPAKGQVEFGEEVPKELFNSIHEDLKDSMRLAAVLKDADANGFLN